MTMLNIISVMFFLAVAVWLIPGMLGGLITTFALRREKGSLQVMDVITIGGRWMFSCFLGGLVSFGLMIFISAIVPEGTTIRPPMLVEYVCFGAGAAVIGSRGAKIILEVLTYN